jgi:hypothetical protein
MLFLSPFPLLPSFLLWVSFLVIKFWLVFQFTSYLNLCADLFCPYIGCFFVSLHAKTSLGRGGWGKEERDSNFLLEGVIHLSNFRAKKPFCSS